MAAPKWIQRAAIKAQQLPVEKQDEVVESRIKQRIGKDVSQSTMLSLKLDIAAEVNEQRHFLRKLLGIRRK